MTGEQFLPGEWPKRTMVVQKNLGELALMKHPDWSDNNDLALGGDSDQAQGNNPPNVLRGLE